MPQSFAPIADARARILILGTMPSAESLRREQYYGHPQNAFWPILFRLFEEALPAGYAERREFLLRRGIALWDVLRACEREGSADAAIRREEPNDFAWLAARCPHLRVLFFNSANAAAFYEKRVRPDPFSALPRHTLPSSSPARAMRFEEKLALWRPVREEWEQAFGKNAIL